MTDLDAAVLLARVRALHARYRRVVRDVIAALTADEDVLALIAQLGAGDARRVQLMVDALEASRLGRTGRR
jgi:hypothetical protein